MNDIDRACAAFRTLLTEQQARVAGMTAERADYTKKATVTIGLVDGDGIGHNQLIPFLKSVKSLLYIFMQIIGKTNFYTIRQYDNSTFTAF